LRAAIQKCLIAALLILGLVYAIANTDNESNWLVVWFLLFFFLGIPVGLICIRDLLLAIFPSSSLSRRAWFILHVCAAFAAAIGWLLGYLAVSSGHPKASLHQWLVLIFPGIVYLVPVVLALHGNTDFLSVLMQAFRSKKNGE